MMTRVLLTFLVGFLVSLGALDSVASASSNLPACPSSGPKHKCFGKQSWKSTDTFVFSNFLNNRFDGYLNAYSKGNVYRCTSSAGSCEGFAQVHINYENSAEENGVEIYTGEVANTLFHGFGRYEWNDGSIYWGSWKSGFRHGMGALLDFSYMKNDGSGVSLYFGNFKNDKKHGYGVLILDHRTTTGQFFDDAIQKQDDIDIGMPILAKEMEPSVSKFEAFLNTAAAFPQYYYDDFLDAVPARALCALSGSKKGRTPFLKQVEERNLICKPKVKFTLPHEYQKKVCEFLEKGKFVLRKDEINAFFQIMTYDLEGYGINCHGKKRPNQIASSITNQQKIPTSAELTAAEKEAERLRQRVAALEAEKAKQQQTISSDTKLPTITIVSASSNGPQGTVKGRVRDNTGIAEVRVDGKQIQIDRDGNFTANTYVPEGGVSMSIQAIDLAGLSSSKSVRIDRAAVQTAAFRFDRLNPLGRKVARNRDAVAIIVGVSDYKETTARAAYADSDAKVFQDYAIEKLGVPRDRIKTLVNDGADEKDMLLAVKRWLARASKRDKTDVYVFFAGHGLASDDGQKMYLLPYDGAPELLDDTAILRDRLFSDIASANPRSVTVFLDTCYSGTTRGTDMLIASRPIAIKALKQSIPDNFTVMTAARGDQTAKPLEEAKHGMFSYFLMKGMEGEADKNRDNKITAGELHQYVQSNVVQQSSGSQTPELQGDAERVLVRFQ